MQAERGLSAKQYIPNTAALTLEAMVQVSTLLMLSVASSMLTMDLIHCKATYTTILWALVIGLSLPRATAAGVFRPERLEAPWKRLLRKRQKEVVLEELIERFSKMDAKEIVAEDVIKEKSAA